MADDQLPSFLPNPPRILLAAFDKWLSEGQYSSEEKICVLRGLTAALQEEGCSAAPSMESIPYLLATEDPPAKWCAVLPASAPALASLMM